MKQWTFFANMNDDPGNIQVYPLYDGCSLENNMETGRIFSRLSLNGNLIFTGDDFDQLKILSLTKVKTEIEIYYDSGKKFSGWIDFAGTWDNDQKKATLSVTVEDAYNKLLNDGSREFNVLSEEDSNLRNYSNYQWSIPDLLANYNGFISIDSAIKLIVGNIDSAVLFDSDSFKAINTNSLDYLYVTSLTNFQLIGSGQRGLSTSMKISFNKITDMLASIHCYWYIDSGYFRLKFWKDRSFGTGIDFKNYKGRNWSLNYDKYTQLGENNFNYIHRNQRAAGADFVGVDIYIPKYDQIATTKQVDLSYFVTDKLGVDQHPELFAFDDDVIFLGQFAEPTLQEIQCNGNGSPGVVITHTTVETIDITALPSTDMKLANSITVLENTQHVFEFILGSFNVLAGTEIQIYDGAYPVSGTPIATKLISDCALYGAKNFIPFIPTGTDISVIVRGMDSGNTLQLISTKATCIYQYLLSMVVGTGAISGQTIENANLALANLDRDHGLYEMPDSEVFINGYPNARVAVPTKNKEYSVKVPIYDPLLIDFNNEVYFDWGALEVTGLSVPLKQDFAIIKGRL